MAKQSPELVTFIKQVQREIIELVVQRLEQHKMSVDEPPLVAKDVLALLGSDDGSGQSPYTSIPLATTKAEFLTRFKGLLTKYPWLKPVYEKYAPASATKKQSPQFCLYCGTKLPENARFCHGCGKQIEAIETEEAEAVRVDELLLEDDLLVGLADAVQESPHAQLIYQLGKLEGAATKGGVKDEMFQEAFSLMNELRGVTDRDVEKLKPVLTAFEHAWMVADRLRKRWEQAAEKNNVRLLAADYLVYAEEGIIATADNAGIDISKLGDLMVAFTSYFGLLAWLDHKVLFYIAYFLCFLGQYQIVKNSKYRQPLVERFGEEWVDTITGDAKIEAASAIFDQDMKKRQGKR